MSEVRAQKVSNAFYLGQIGDKINEFYKKIKVRGITYESLFSYFQHTVQLGGDIKEFWVAWEDGKVVGFAHWLVHGWPHVATCYCDFIYNWSKNPDVALALIKEFEAFGKKRNCVYFEGDAINKTVFRRFKKIIEEKEYVAEESGHVNFICFKPAKPVEKKEKKTKPKEEQ